MTSPRPTPNPGTTTHPAQSSKRTARKKPLAWLPWALLAALALLLALIFLLVNAIDDDGAEGPADDSLGQVSAESGTRNGAAVGPSSDASASPGSASSGAGSVDVAALTAAALVGGAGTPAAQGAASAATQGMREPGTAGTVLFAEGSAALDAEANKVITSAVQLLKQAGATSVTVYGYTDVIAGDAVNDPLSKERADAVAAQLSRQLPGVTVTTAARGQDSPVADNKTPAGRQQNRRAAIVATA